MSRVSEWPVLKTMPRRRVNREMASTSSRLAAAITSVEIPCTQFTNVMDPGSYIIFFGSGSYFSVGVGFGSGSCVGS